MRSALRLTVYRRALKTWPSKLAIVSRETILPQSENKSKNQSENLAR